MANISAGLNSLNLAAYRPCDLVEMAINDHLSDLSTACVGLFLASI